MEEGVLGVLVLPQPANTTVAKKIVKSKVRIVVIGLFSLFVLQANGDIWCFCTLSSIIAALNHSAY